MSIEAMYPSRRQSRLQNPLFARSLRRQKLFLMLALTAVGVGLLLVQIIPVTAHADAASTETQPAAVIAAPVKAGISVKSIRQIQIYSAN